MREANTLRVAVLGDVHGHLSLAYTLLRRWERENNYTLDAILQVGDMGAYPPPYRLDKPTKRFAEHDPDELGFTAYHAGDEEAAAFLGPDAEPHRYVAADTFFIRGNHEDFVYLDEVARGAKGPVPVDAFERIHYLPNGQRFELSRRGATLRVAALGGISHQGGAGHDPIHYTTHDVRVLSKSSEPVDVLLTHEPAYDSGRALGPHYAGQGSRDVARLLSELRPQYHFCGHWHEPGARLAAPDDVVSHQLNAVNFHKPSRLNPGCMGVLTWSSPGRHHFEWVEGAWVAEYTRATWRALMQHGE